MKINKRLEIISHYVEKNSNVIDVGCDHAKLSIYLVLNNVSKNLIASDINEKPLEQARKNIRLYNLDNYINIRLGDGISTMDENIDTIIISGMGGKNIVDILNKDKDKLKKIKRIILSPNNNSQFIREFLDIINFKIVNEQIVLENNKFYNIIVLERGNTRYSWLEILFGYNVLKDECYFKYCNYILQKYRNNLDKLPLKYINDRNNLKKYINYYENELKLNKK